MGRILANGLFAGFVTGLTLAALLLAVKGLFFFADSGYPDFNRVDENGNPIPPFCDPGAGCVYARYLADGRGDALAAEGVTDAASFTPFYWSQQLATAGILLVLTSGAASAARCCTDWRGRVARSPPLQRARTPARPEGALRRSGAISATYEPGSCSADANRAGRSSPHEHSGSPPDTSPGLPVGNRVRSIAEHEHGSYLARSLARGP